MAVAVAEVDGELEEVRIIPEGLRRLLELLAGQVGLSGLHVEPQQVGKHFGILRVRRHFPLQGVDLAVCLAQPRDPLPGLAHSAVVRIALDGTIPNRGHLVPALLHPQDVAQGDERLHIVRVQLQGLTIGPLRLGPHLPCTVNVARRIAQLGERTLRVEILVEIFVRQQPFDVIVPITEILSHNFRGQGLQRLLVQPVAQTVGHRVRIGPLHGEAFLDEEFPLVLVLLKNPLRDGRMVKDADIRVLRIGPRRQVHRDAAYDLHQFLLARHDRFVDRILLVAAQPFFEPTFGFRAAGRIVIVDVFLIECVGQCVLRDNDQIAAVEVRIPPVLRVDETFAENHVGRHEAPRIGAPEDKGVFRQVLEHIVPVMPAEPVVALAAERGVVDASPERQQRQSVGGIAQRRTHGDQPRDHVARASRAEQGKKQIGVAMIRKLQRPGVDRRLGALHDRLEESREDEAEKEEIKEGPLVQR